MKRYYLIVCSLGLCGILAVPQAPAGEIVIGTYQLSSHPDGNQNPPPYGLRLDELFNFTSGHDVIAFDFNAPGADMRMTYDGTSIHIFGTAFGGLHDGNVYSSDAAHTSLVEIDFTYTLTSLASGDDDLIVTTPDFSNTGTITWLDTGEVIDLWDYSGGNGFTFRFGDEDNDLGHRGFDGFSGWGWVNHDEMTEHISASDWLFTGQLIPVPPAVLLGGVGLVGMFLLRRRLI